MFTGIYREMLELLYWNDFNIIPIAKSSCLEILCASSSGDGMRQVAEGCHHATNCRLEHWKFSLPENYLWSELMFFSRREF